MVKRKDTEGGVGWPVSDHNNNNNKDNTISKILSALHQSQQLNPTNEDLLYILHKINSKNESIRWSSFPKDLWPSVFLHLTSLKDFSTAQQVCKSWNTTLLTEHFWENYVSSTWNLDPTIKTQYTFPASKYTKLRIFLENNCNGIKGVYHTITDTLECEARGHYRVHITSLILLSPKQVGFVCANWFINQNPSLLPNSPIYCPAQPGYVPGEGT
eukprot:TRINITY_DN3555_c0_g1_i3.p1 TRINITY_DN3555_c0_g1~~TRINITY_DN3555_c0_g1_i3.p1  ORF type:complete len:214 (-),score=62.04 TRINITY_DN3555_c0_g1_i3:24-665(-)